jgi:hypothetical protein
MRRRQRALGARHAALLLFVAAAALQAAGVQAVLVRRQQTPKQLDSSPVEPVAEEAAAQEVPAAVSSEPPAPPPPPPPAPALQPPAPPELDVAARWAEWLAGEQVAHKYTRTRAELERFGAHCAFMAPSWARLADAHASLARVIVVDVRHNWNGLGDSHERWNFLLRVARSTGRAAFLWADDCADMDGPVRAKAPNVPGAVRPPGCQFDPGAYVSGFGGVDWRWDAAMRRRVQLAQGVDAREVAIQYQCLQEVSRGCGSAVLRWAVNGSEALRVEGAEAEATALPVQAFLMDTLTRHPWLRLETTVQGDLTREAFSAVSCRAVGHADKPECSQSCESFANWRPRARTWAALRASLLRIDAWAAVGSITARTGAADHFGAMPYTLTPGEPGLSPPGGAPALTPVPAAELSSRTEALFTPCGPDAPAFQRDKKPSETPCVHWRSDDKDGLTPTAQLAMRCSGSIGELAVAAAAANASAPSFEPLFAVSDGPLGAFIACAARGAAALAAADKVPDSWGVLLFSDAPGFKCILESSALAAAGHAASTATVPGHTQYAPAGPLLRAAGMSAVTDWYLLGLVDISLHVFSSAFGGSANVRNFRGHRHPPNAPNPALQRGFERWFEAGRENRGAQGVDAGTMALLAATHDGCPLQQRSVREAAKLYAAHAAKG